MPDDPSSSRKSWSRQWQSKYRTWFLPGHGGATEASSVHGFALLMVRFSPENSVSGSCRDQGNGSRGPPRRDMWAYEGGAPAAAGSAHTAHRADSARAILFTASIARPLPAYDQPMLRADGPRRESDADPMSGIQ